MDLKRLRYFCTIIEQGSISKAAQVLCIAQPPLSKRLQELEEEIGARLIDRSGRGVVPTEAGHYLYQRACEILRSVEDARRKAIAIADTERHVLRVGISYLFQRFFFPVVQALYERNPRAEISVSISDSSHLEQLLQRGAIDVVLIQRPQNAEGFELLDFPPMGLRVLIPLSLGLDVSRGWVTLEEVGHYPLILLRRVEGPGTFEIILDQLRKAGVVPDVKMHVSNPYLAIEMLEAGTQAIAFLPESEALPSRHDKFISVEVRPSPLVFMPVAARLTSNVAISEVVDIISGFRRSL